MKNSHIIKQLNKTIKDLRYQLYWQKQYGQVESLEYMKRSHTESKIREGWYRKEANYKRQIKELELENIQLRLEKQSPVEGGCYDFQR